MMEHNLLAISHDGKVHIQFVFAIIVCFNLIILSLFNQSNATKPETVTE